MSDYIYEEGGQVAYIKRDRVKGDRAFDLHNRERYRVEGSKLLDLTSGKIMGYIDMLGRDLARRANRACSTLLIQIAATIQP